MPWIDSTLLLVAFEEKQGLSSDAVQAGRGWMPADSVSKAANHNDEGATGSGQEPSHGVLSFSGLV